MRLPGISQQMSILKANRHLQLYPMWKKSAAGDTGQLFAAAPLPPWQLIYHPSLDVVQQPERARMCGYGDKVCTRAFVS